MTQFSLRERAAVAERRAARGDDRERQPQPLLTTEDGAVTLALQHAADAVTAAVKKKSS